MKPLHRGLAVAAIHCLLVLSLAGKYAIDRVRLPRAWARATMVDPNLPLRGRYVSIRLDVDAPAGIADYAQAASLSSRNGRLVATPSPPGTGVSIWTIGDQATLADPVPFFIGERAADPSWRSQGEELWVEVSVPRKGPPRPLRLAVKKDGVLTPLNLR